MTAFLWVQKLLKGKTRDAQNPLGRGGTMPARASRASRDEAVTSIQHNDGSVVGYRN